MSTNAGVWCFSIVLNRIELSNVSLESIADECEVDAVLGKRQVAARLVPLLEVLLRTESGTLPRVRVVIPDRVGGQ